MRNLRTRASAAHMVWREGVLWATRPAETKVVRRRHAGSRGGGSEKVGGRVGDCGCGSWPAGRAVGGEAWAGFAAFRDEDFRVSDAGGCYASGAEGTDPTDFDAGGFDFGEGDVDCWWWLLGCCGRESTCSSPAY